MTRPLCVNPRCAIPRRHRDGCAGETCRGCLPGWAADGSRLCLVCGRRIGENAVKAAELHGELELMLRPSGNGGPASGKPGSASPPRDAVVAMRTEIRAVLVSWCLLVSDERGISAPHSWAHQLVSLPPGVQGPWERVRVRVPDDRLEAMGAYLRYHSDWLGASDYADEVVDELASLASRAWGLAYPDGAHRIRVGPCPRCGGVQRSDGWVVERLPVGFIGPPRRSGCLVAVVRDKDQDKLPAEVFCDRVDEHRWPAPQWRQLDREVMARKRVAA